MEGGGTNLRPKVTLAQLRDRWIEQQQLEQKKQEERERKQQQEQQQQEAQGQEGTGEEAQPPSTNHRRRRNSMEGGGTNLRPKVTLAQLRGRWIEQQQLEQKKQEEHERKQQQEQQQQEAQGQVGTGEEAQSPSKNRRRRRRRNSMEGGGTNLRPKVTLAQLRDRWIERQQLEQKKQEERERKQQQEHQQQEAQGQEGTGEEAQPPSKNRRRRWNSRYNRKPKVTFPSTEMVLAAPAAAVSTEEEEELKRETSVGGIEKDGARTLIGVGKEKGNAYAGTGEYVRKRGKSVVHRPKAGNVWALKPEQKTQKVGVEQKTQKVVKVYYVGVIKAEPETQKVEVEQKAEKVVEIAQKKTENAEERVGGTVETIEPKIGKMFMEKGDDKSERKAVVINHRNRWFNSGVRRGYDGLKRGGYGGSRGFRDFNNGGNVLYRETNGRFNRVWGRNQKDGGKVWVRKEDAVTEGAGDGGVAAAGGSESR